MKTMSDYTLFCTPEQTRKALELGAPIKEAMSRYNAWNALQRIKSGKETYEEYANKGVAIINGKYVVKALTIPTAEQMLGFFRSKNIHIVIQKDVVDDWSAYGHEIAPVEFTVFDRLTGYKSYKEATLAAIDAALEYLIRNNK